MIQIYRENHFFKCIIRLICTLTKSVLTMKAYEWISDSLRNKNKLKRYLLRK